jgi:catechol 2,3-dioxygenase-like lactoylglutathione lyase family enzyme
MNITIHSSFLPHTDPDASLAFYRDTLGFEVRKDVGYGGMRWITVGPADQPDTAHSRGWRPAAPTSSRSRPSSRMGFAIARSAIRRATSYASTSSAEPFGDRSHERNRDR